MVRLCLCLILINFITFNVHAQPSKQDIQYIDKKYKKLNQLYKSGKYKEALKLAKKNLQDAERILGKEHPKTLAAANSLAVMYVVNNQYDLAKPLYQRALEDRERILGKEHPDTLKVINNLAIFYKDRGRYTLAEPLYQRALEGRERVLGKEHPDTLSSVNNLAIFYENRGRHTLAEPLYQRALEGRERVLGKEHPNTLLSVNNLASFYENQRRYTLAEPLYRRTLEVRERVLGKEHSDTLSSVISLAILYKNQRRYTLAETLYKRALGGRERVLGKEHPDTLSSINNLAILYMEQSRYKLAEPLYKRVVEGRERVLGKEHRDTLSSVISLADLYQTNGQYVLAEPLYKRALEVRERVSGNEHPDTIRVVNNLASLYRFQGRYKLAVPLLKRGLVTYERILGKEHPDTFISAHNLAALYMIQKRYGRARTLMERTLEGRERVLGKEHPDTLSSIHNLATLYENQDRYKLAESMYKRALEARERILGKEHPDTLESISSLASLYQFQGQYTLAEPLSTRAVEVKERVLGKEHPKTLWSITTLGDLHYKQQKWQLAENLFDRSTSGYARRSKLSEINTLGGQENSIARRYSIIFKIHLKAAYHVAQSDKKQHDPLARKNFTRTQWMSGAGASAALSKMAARLGTGDDRLAELVRKRQDLVQDWKKYDGVLSKAVGLPTNKRNAALEKKFQAHLQSIRKHIDQIDIIFQKDFPNYAALANPEPLTLEQTQAQLREDEALVYFVDTLKYDKTPGEVFTWIVTKNNMTWVRSPLGTPDLTRMVKRLRCGLDAVEWQDSKKANACRKLLKIRYSNSDYQNGRPLPFQTSLAYDLYEGLFGQAKDIIKGKKLLLVPSGPLTSLPFQVLLTEKPAQGVAYSQMKWLIHKHDLTVLPSVASLRSLRRTSKSSSATKSYFGIGNPLLLGPSGTDKSAWKKQACDFKTKRAPIKVAGWVVPEGITKYFRGGKVNLALLKRQYPLPETADELCTVAQVLGAQADSVKLGTKATEENLKKLSDQGVLKQARILHFATHGLLAGETEQLIKNKAEPSLILTPPNKISDKDDGLLTASEITQLKLDADWVILSACNTAAGDKPGAEAMSGLAKAFFYAGARALLVSHWYVNSNATVKLVTKSFEALKQDSTLGRAGALRKAMQALIKDKSTSHPEYWAPFVVIGEGHI